MSCWGFSFALERGVSPQSHSSAAQMLLQRCAKQHWSWSSVCLKETSGLCPLPHELKTFSTQASVCRPSPRNRALGTFPPMLRWGCGGGAVSHLPLLKTTGDPLFSLCISPLPGSLSWALGSITMKKASGGDGIPVELFQILKDDAMKVLHAICHHSWKTQQWPQNWKRSVFITITKKGNAKECSNYIQLHSSHTLVK